MTTSPVLTPDANQSAQVPNPRSSRGSIKHHPLFLPLRILTNLLLVLSVFLLLYSLGWEYSTRRYLKGFSDAIIPLAAPPEDRVEAILSWMKHGPARQDKLAPSGFDTRNPEETLNYRQLLLVCGSATNAFVNLANSSGIPARRLLLVDKNGSAKHVLAEVYLDGRWIVVDPSFRAVFRDAQGRTLTRGELGNNATFRQATQNIPGYDPDYTFDRPSHVRLSKIPVVGLRLENILDRIWPNWSDSVYWTLLLERESFAATVLACLLVLFLSLQRLVVRSYGEARLGIRSYRVREQWLRVGRAFLRPPA